MSMQTQTVAHPYSEKRDRKDWRRRRKSCGNWTIVHYKAKNPLCEKCQALPPEQRGNADLAAYQFWKVLECPDPFGYRPGAVFTAMEWEYMKNMMALIPGMIVEKGTGEREKVLSNLKVIEVTA